MLIVEIPILNSKYDIIYEHDPCNRMDSKRPEVVDTKYLIQNISKETDILNYVD